MAGRTLSASTNFQDIGMTPEDRLKRMENMANDFTVDCHQPIRRYVISTQKLNKDYVVIFINMLI